MNLDLDPIRWVYELGYCTGCTGHWAHPVAPMNELVELLDEHLNDEVIVEALIERGIASPDDEGPDGPVFRDSRVPRDAAVDLVGYARRALLAARELMDVLKRAVAAHERGDIEEAQALIEEAQGLENWWGDDPTVTEVREALKL